MAITRAEIAVKAISIRLFRSVQKYLPSPRSVLLGCNSFLSFRISGIMTLWIMSEITRTICEFLTVQVPLVW